MTPARLTAAAFRSYPATGQRFAAHHLALLQQLPLALCPSFLRQIQQLNTSFPVERAALDEQCEKLEALPPAELHRLLAPFQSIHLSPELLRSDWVAQPARFLDDLASYLWSSAQIDGFREASRALITEGPRLEAGRDRLTLVVIGRGAPAPTFPLFSRLRRHGILLTNIATDTMPAQMLEIVRARAMADTSGYAHWYIDGGVPWPHTFADLPSAVSISYPALAPLRNSILQAMQRSIESGSAGAESMRADLAATAPAAMGAGSVTADAVLQRFYAELFTLGSGTQIFSTSFIQWAGREVLRRAQPRTLLLRYAPRQSFRSFNDIVANHTGPPTLDPKGSLRDADMGAYYTWLEMDRITQTGYGTFAVWLEQNSQLLLIAPSAPKGTTSASPLTLQQALRDFA